MDGIDGIPAPKVISEIHKQLITGFQPATKLVAENGTNLLRAFQNLTKQCDAYIRALEGLARSGEKAFLEGKRRATELELIVATMKSVNEKHKENVEKFSQLVGKTNEYSREEKEKLKDMSHSYESREKAIKKAVAKKTQEPEDLQKFYIHEMESALWQQSQRYKFSADKHGEWLKSYIELLQFTNQLTGAAGSQQDNTQHPAAVQQSPQDTKRPTPPDRLEDVPVISDDDIPHIVEDLSPISVDLQKDSKDEESVATASRIDEAFGWITEVKKEEEPKSRDAATMCVEDAETQAGGTENDALENFILANPMYSKPPPLPKRTHASLPRTDQNDQDEFYEPGARKHANVRKDEEYTHYKYEEPAVPKGQYEQMPANAWIVKPPYEQRPVSDLQPPVPPTRAAFGEKPPVAARTDSRRPLSQANGVLFNPKNINAVPTAFIPPPFGASDNGKLLICVHNFHGQTTNQLSLSAGDRIVLIKSGSKGWIFAKHVETQRTGWFPSRFVQLIPDVTEESPP